MMAQLSEAAFNDLNHMLADLEMRKKLFMNDGALANHWKLNKDGSMLLGRTKYDWLNRIFNDRKEVSVNDLCLKIIAEISGQGQTRNRDAFRALGIDFIEKALERKDYNAAITRIFVAYRMEFVGDLQRMEEYQDNHPDRRPQQQKKQQVTCYQQVSSNEKEYIAICSDGIGGVSLHKITK